MVASLVALGLKWLLLLLVVLFSRHRGGFKLSPTEARAKLAQGVKDPLEARLLHMLAVRGKRQTKF